MAQRYLDLTKFISLNKIQVSPRVKQVCLEGISVMRKSQDPLHDENHVFRILYNLDRFLKESDDLRGKKINFEILLLAICWHDTWKSHRFATAGHKLLYHQVYEGLGSMRAFGKMSKLYSLDSYTVKKVKYAIRKHSMFQFLPIRGVEAKILKDLDKLDEWSGERLARVIHSSFEWGLFSARTIKIYKFYLEHFVSFRKKSYYPWTSLEIEKEKPYFYKNLMEILNLLPHPFLSTEKQTIYPESEE